MNYFRLCHKYKNSGYIDGSMEFFPPLFDYYYPNQTLCTQFASEEIKVKVILDSCVRKLKADFFYVTGRGFFASERLSLLLKRYQNDLHIIKAETFYHNGKPTEQKYSLVHTEYVLECFDYESSEYDGKDRILRRLKQGKSMDKIFIEDFTSIAIDEKRAKGANYFFLDRNILFLDPIISETLAQEITQNKFHVRLEPTKTIVD
jgi:hypothetical protein